MKFLTFLFVSINLFFNQQSLCQYKVDSMCGAKVILDKNNKILARYYPMTPGLGYVKSVKLAVDFLKNCPISKTNKLPLYITHCSMYANTQTGEFYGSSWPHNPAVVNGGLVQSLAVDWRNYSGDNSMIDLARQGVDHQIKNGTTPANWEWANVPYASSEAGDVVYDGASMFDTATTDLNKGRGDGSYVLEVDKIGDMGIHYLKFYQITNETKYLTQAINCADALAKHVRKGSNNNNKGLDWVNLAITSPWPFRVKAETGKVLEDYTSHTVENLRLIDELIRINKRINLPKEKLAAYKNASELVWYWMYTSEGPLKTSIWKGYFEDIRWDPINLNRVNNSPMEFARYVLKNPIHDANIYTTIPSLIWWVKGTFAEPGMNAINEQTGCYLPMGSHTARYASICAMWYEQSGDKWYKEEAYRNFNHATYMARPNGVVETGHNWGSEIWFSDGYTDYIRHFMEGLGAVPEWSPSDENHLLRSESTVQKIVYNKKYINFTTYDNETKAVLRLIAKPKNIKINNSTLAETKSTQAIGWTWTPLATGGVLKINQNLGNEVKIEL